MPTTRYHYALAILAQGHYVTDYHHMKALVAIMADEGSTAAWNPLDTTLDQPDATPYNSFGPNGELHVWNYPTAEEGVKATLATLAQPNMGLFADALRRQQADAIEVCRAYAEVPWSFVGNLLPMRLCELWNRHPVELQLAEQQLVHGTGVWPYQANGQLHG